MTCMPLPLSHTHAHSNTRTALCPAGKTRRAMGKRSLFHKLKDYKRALVQLRDDKTIIEAPAPAAPAGKQQLQ